MKLELAAAKWILQKGPEIWLTVVRGGCTGFMYRWSRTSQKDSNILGEMHGVRVYTDKPELLRNVQIKLKSSLFGTGLEVTNPDAVTSCRCSRSFVSKKAVKAKNELQDGGACGRLKY